MLTPILFGIFWMIFILWAIYYWYWDTSKNQTAKSSGMNTPKVVFDFTPDKRHSASSIESVEYSDNEGIRRKNMQKLKYEIKTRWPSKTLVKARDRTKSL